VIVPVGFIPPESVAVSDTGNPTVTVAAETCVLIVVVAAVLVIAKLAELYPAALATTW
jgi:hypothetical protein